MNDDPTIRAEPATGDEPGVLARGTVIGRYIVLERIGAGAMGVVYSGFDPVLDRRVALKKVRVAAHRGSREASDRLLREAQTLAKLAHPNVVAVHDVLVVDDGIVIAMDFVDGDSLREWLEARERTWQEVVDVMLQAGRGLWAAHRAGVVHRDFKPDNVMVDHDGQVFVVDFGLARVADAGDTVRSHTGEAGDLDETRDTAGTPAYMAPEVFDSQLADAHSDQFSFCVTLYEALYRIRPFKADSLAALVSRLHRGDIEPPPPSAAVPRRIRQVALRGLARDPDARHADMDGVVQALARARAWGWRRPAMLASLTAVAVVGAAALGMNLRPEPCADGRAGLADAWDAELATQIRTRFDALELAWARDAGSRTEAGLHEYASAWATEWTDNCEATRVRGDQSERLLDLRSACLQDRRRSLAATTRRLADADIDVALHADDLVAHLPPIQPCADGEPLRRAAAGLTEPPDPAAADAIAATRDALAEAEVTLAAGKYAEGLAAAQRVAAAADATRYGPLRAEARFTLGRAYKLEGDQAQAETALVEASELAVRHGDDVTAARAASELVYVTGARRRKTDGAHAWTSGARALIDKLGDDPLRAQFLLDHGLFMYAARETDAAVTDLREALKLRESLPGDDKLQIAKVQNALANALDAAGNHVEALRLYETTHQVQLGVLGPTHPGLGAVLSNQADSLARAGELDRARDYAEQALALYRRSLPPDHPNLASALINLNVVLWELGDYDGCARVLDEAREIYEASEASADDVATVYNNLGGVAWMRDETDVARGHFERAVSALEAQHGPDYVEIADPLGSLGVLAWDTKDWAAAKSYHARAVAILEKAGVGGHRDAGHYLRQLAYDHLQLGDHEESARVARDAVARLEGSPGSGEEIAQARYIEGRALAKLGRADESRRLVRSARDELPEADRDEADAWLARR